MRKYNLFTATMCIFAFAVLASTANAQYWFQSGVKGSNEAAFNNGAGVSIQTIYQNATIGSLGFWVGESLSNGAFIQAGYEIPNSTGYYSSSCGKSEQNVFLDSGTPTWFWEYFMPNNDNNSFCGGIGPNGSAGANGTYQTYSFRSTNNVWDVYFNGQNVGSVNLGVGNSGANPPTAFAEYAGTNANTWPMNTVKFRDLVYYTENVSRAVPAGSASIGYGKGSLTALGNPYGVEEVGNFVNYFQVGSGIPIIKFAQLWKLGYMVGVSSQYGNVSGGGNYIAYSLVPLGAPRTINISIGVRELFTGWIGRGPNSYTGNNTNPYIMLYNNITETATWKTQYYLNATTRFGRLYGAGWYDANTSAVAYIGSSDVGTAQGSRVTFSSWSNGDTSNNTIVYMGGPRSVQAIWRQQYYLNLTTQYGNAEGSGWYDANSTANISLSTTTVPINQSSRLEFSNWSNGNPSSSTAVLMSGPLSLRALFGKQYLVELDPQNSGGQSIGSVDYYNISNRIVSANSVFLFGGQPYNIEYMHYKGVLVSINNRFVVNSPTILKFRTPIYDIVINTESVFGSPVNASLNITFKNNTNVKVYSGKRGTQSFYDVPYGYISGYADYLGIRQSINIANGTRQYMTFITGSLIAFIIGGILLIVAVAKITSYYRQRPRAAARR